MNNDIQTMIGTCETWCQIYRASQHAEPLIQVEDVSSPIEQVGIDLFKHGGKHLVVMVDRFSGWPFCAQLPNLTTTAVPLFLYDGTTGLTRSEWIMAAPYFNTVDF
ncbi:hypothetical protein TCAL_15499 [Tigriopus californicus]|uniref:Uncharacterized protein n=1 Tax=Tigriopus californicus TaxID=6832 RepID=A0A553PRW9_TIGCA|nr:hypothetical protein TCAL_15499 [Tigriopus californicus]